MDIEVMQAEAAITSFINSFIEFARNPKSGVDEEDVNTFEQLLNVAKTIHIAKLSISKLTGVDFDKLLNDSDEDEPY